MKSTGTITIGAGGLGSGFITVWFWNKVLAPRYGLPEIPAEVATALAPILVQIALSIVERANQLEEYLFSFLPPKREPKP